MRSSEAAGPPAHGRPNRRATALVTVAVAAAVVALTACTGPGGLGAPSAAAPAVSGVEVSRRPTTGPATAPPDPATRPTGAATAPSDQAQRPSRSSPSSSGPAPGPLADRTLIATDDFAGGSLDPGRWQVYDDLATNGVSRWTPDRVAVSGGELRITGTGRDPSGAANRSGGVCWCSAATVATYGAWQVRAKFDRGIGFGQAILLWPHSQRWPDDGEIDLVEAPTSAKATAFATVHWGTSADHRQDEQQAAGDLTAWHVYTVDWRPGRIRIYIDAALLYDSARAAHPPVIPSGPMELALQQEPGPFGDSWVPAPTAATPAQVVMRVDWVRLYR